MNFYISDLHFGHKAAIQYDNRPFWDTADMERELIANWNAVVHPKDTVYIVGDFSWGNADEWLRIIRKLKGQKVLIEGNHDLKTYPEELRKEFLDIAPYKEIVDNGSGSEGRKVILSHYPIMLYKHSNNRKYYMICGHVHRSQENYYLQKWIAELRRESGGNGSYKSHFGNCGQIYNVGCMMPWMNYTPQTLDQIVQNYEATMSRKDWPPTFAY